MRTGLDLKEDEIRSSTPDPLTQRMFLSQTIGFYDPISLASPAKQKGMMLIRDSYQEAERGHLAKDTWDDPLSPRLREASIKLFEKYVRLSHIRFKLRPTSRGAVGAQYGLHFPMEARPPMELFFTSGGRQWKRGSS